MFGKAVLLAVLLVCAPRCCWCNYAMGDPAPMCWKLAPGNPAIECPTGLDIDWIEPYSPPATVAVGQEFNLRVSINITTDTAAELETQSLISLADPNATAQDLLDRCFKENEECSDTHADKCCYFHVNIHSCLNVPGTFCGPWVGNDGYLATHTPATHGSAGPHGQTTYTFNQQLFWEGSYTVIAHFKFAAMHFAVGKTIEVFFAGDICGESTVPKSDGSGDCETCPSGTQSLNSGIPSGSKQLTNDEAQNLSINPFCVLCPPGRYSSNGTLCVETDLGHFQNGIMKAEQKPCPRGTSAWYTGATACHDCTPGTYAADPGSSMCSSCPVGKTGDVVGLTACEPCEGDLTTEHRGATDCQCGRGTYRDKDNRNRCIPCPSGMDCDFFGADEVNFEAFATLADAGPTTPMLMPGYFSTKEDPLSVFKCLSEEKCACPGGAPGACYGDGDEARVGLLCFECQEGFKRGECGCEPCAEISKAGIVVLPIVGLIGCVVLYYLGNSGYTNKGSISLTFCILLGLIVTVVWVCAMMNDLVLPWPVAQRNLFESLSIFTLNPDALGLECSLGASPLALYAFRCMGPVMIVVAVMLCHCLSKLAALAKPELAWELDKSINTIGTIFQAVFILVAVISVDPFNHYSHPNGRQSMESSPTVMFGESGEWTSFAALGIAVFLVFVLPFFAITVLGTIKAPALGAQPWFIRRFRFMLYRFRPDCWWWGVLLNLRQILLAFASSLPADDPHVQSTYLVCILGVYLILVVRFWPWKNTELNVAEVSLFTLVMFMIKSCTAFMEPSPRPGGHTATIMVFMVFIASNILIYIGMICWALFQKRDLSAEFTFRSGPQLQDKAIEQFRRLCQNCSSLGEKELSEIMRCMSGYDIHSVLLALSAFHGAAPDLFSKPSAGRVSDLALTRVASISSNASRSSSERSPPNPSSAGGSSLETDEPDSSVPAAGKPAEAGLPGSDDAHPAFQADQEDPAPV